MKPLIVVYSLLMMLFCCSCGSGHPDRRVTEENAYEGVSNYCHQMYEWSIAQENPSIMYVEMGVESDSMYEVVFRSYTGATVHFYVDKHKDANETGGLLYALQLTSEFKNFKKSEHQNGCLFYIPAWKTSKIDPATGFANLFDTRYTNAEKALEFFI